MRVSIVFALAIAGYSQASQESKPVALRSQESAATNSVNLDKSDPMRSDPDGSRATTPNMSPLALMRRQSTPRNWFNSERPCLWPLLGPFISAFNMKQHSRAPKEHYRSNAEEDENSSPWLDHFTQERIVGGEPTRPGLYPWMISLQKIRVKIFNYTVSRHMCGAALLNENWAVTAAHCVTHQDPKKLLVRLGGYDLTDPSKSLANILGCEPPGHLERHIQTVVSHPGFNVSTIENDIALIKFSEPVNMAYNVKSIPMAEGNRTFVGENAVVIGWGTMWEDGESPPILREVEVPVISNEDCENWYTKAAVIKELPSSFMCAGLSTGGKDSCEGDSGGPLMWKDEGTGRWTLIGIVSWGDGCARRQRPGVYTRITHFVDWIKQELVTHT